MPVDSIRKLHTVNECLRTMGETELASVEEFHPFANDALALLDLEVRALQTRPRSFNTFYAEWKPTVNGQIVVPNDAGSVVSVVPGRRVTVLDRRLWDMNTDSDSFTGPVKVRFTRILGTESIPDYAFEYASALAAVRFAEQFDADPAKIQSLQQHALRRYEDFMALELAASQVNAFDQNHTILRIRAQRGWR